MRPSLSPRFGTETAFLLGVAAILYLLEAAPLAAVATMLVAWALVALLELVAPGRRPPDEPAQAERPPIVPEGEEHELYLAAGIAGLPRARPEAGTTVFLADGQRAEEEPGVEPEREAEPALEPEPR